MQALFALAQLGARQSWSAGPLQAAATQVAGESHSAVAGAAALVAESFAVGALLAWSEED